MMHRFIFLFIFILSISVSFAQPVSNEIPVLIAKSEMADYNISGDYVRGAWRIAPEVKFDTLFVKCFNDVEKFIFYTDQDSIRFDLSPGVSYSFYVQLDTAKAFTIISGVLPDYKEAKYCTVSKNDEFKFLYEENIDNEYLTKLRTEYKLDQIIEDA